MSESTPHVETPAEETVSALTHALGAALSVAGLAVLVTFASFVGSARLIVAVSLFGASMILVYVASTLYHACRRQRAKSILQVLDHIAIYALIAGSYTPFLLVSIGGGWGWSLFGVLWGLALAGTLFKILLGRMLRFRWFDIVSTALYVAMGWIGLIAARPFFDSLPGGALWWLMAGGVAYTAGIVFYLWDHLPFNHAIWHVFVMAGTTCHFFAILLYVVPG